jgi:hypothetical protein
MVMPWGESGIKKTSYSTTKININRKEVRGASKIKLKKVNKKRTVTVRRVIIF